jgi:nicotinamidase/pyrazinamidase
MPDEKDGPGEGDALLIVDMQNDFCPGGALPIKEGDRVVPVVNEWIEAAVAGSVPVYASRDWHPLDHPSFKENGGLWPRHCLQDTWGAAFHAALRLPPSAVIVTKGTRFDKDQNSAFDETGLADLLAKKGIRRLFVAGLAEDVCVLATVLDALKAGFAATVIAAGTRGVTEEGAKAARDRMAAAGARFAA